MKLIRDADTLIAVLEQGDLKSDLNAEIHQLSRGETGRYLFFDTNGTILAANDDSLLATRVTDDTLPHGDLGFHRIHGDVTVVEEVPSAGWRIAFEQDAGEFESGLSGPI